MSDVAPPSGSTDDFRETNSSQSKGGVALASGRFANKLSARAIKGTPGGGSPNTSETSQAHDCSSLVQPGAWSNERSVILKSTVTAHPPSNGARSSEFTPTEVTTLTITTFGGNYGCCGWIVNGGC